jgi:hypothetical protein
MEAYTNRPPPPKKALRPYRVLRAPAWAGAITDTSAPTSAELDWVKVYDWKG